MALSFYTIFMSTACDSKLGKHIPARGRRMASLNNKRFVSIEHSLAVKSPPFFYPFINLLLLVFFGAQ